MKMRTLMADRLFTVMLCFGFVGVSFGQNAITPPYYCGFEDAVENALWELNVGGGLCNDKWYIGSAAFNEGTHSLYISDDDGRDAFFGAKQNVTVVRRAFTIPDGFYEVSFDWRNMAQANSGLYVCLYRQGSTILPPASDPVSAAIPQWVQDTWRDDLVLSDGSVMKCLFGKSDWTTTSFQFSMSGNIPLELAFVWINANTDEKITYPLAACIDNLQITSLECYKPRDFKVDAHCDSVVMSWAGDGFSTYSIEYKPNGASTWRVINDVRGDSYLLTGISEGVYDFRMRTLCFDYVTDKKSYSAYVTQNSQLVFCPGNHCINYVDFTDPSVSCYTGLAGNPNSFVKCDKPVDYGPEEALSRHTVNWTRKVYDPRTGYRLPTIPEGELASIRLGNWLLDGEAERIEFKYRVDAENTPILLMKYAIVFEDPEGHDETDKPYFSLRILDGDGFQIDPACGHVEFYADRNREGWHMEQEEDRDGVQSVIMWKDWTTIGLNVGDYDGQDITIQLETGDCTLLGHYGYAYFSLGCASGEIRTIGCGADDKMEMVAPEGFDYEWYLTEDDVLSRKQSYTVDAADTRTFYCRCSLKEKSGCSFVLSTMVAPREAYADYSYEWKPSNCQNIVRFRNKSHVISFDDDDNIIHTDEPCETTTWTFPGNDIIVENDPVYIFPPEGGTFDFSVKTEISNGKCFDVREGRIKVPSIVATHDTIVDTICHGGFYPFAGKILFKSDTVVHQTFNVAGCDSTVTLFLTVRPKIEDTVLDTTICHGDTLWVSMFSFTEPVNEKSVTLYTDRGCDSTVILNLTILDEVTFTASAIPEKETPNSGAIIIEDAPDNYTWTINGVENGALTGLPGGTYTVVVYNSHGCASKPIEVFIDRECLDVDVAVTGHVVCDGKFTIPFTVNSGFLSDYVISYDQKALDVGFENDSIAFVPGVQTLEVMVPAQCRPDFYTATLTFKDVICEDNVFPLTIEVDYPDTVVAQKWNDVLVVKNSDYNGGYDFSAFQWYRNDVLLPGETKPYIYLSNDEVFDTADEYRVLLTRSNDGVSISSCPVTPVVRSDVKDYPTVTVSQIGAKVMLSGISGIADVCIYDVLGRLIKKETAYGRVSELTMPSMTGVYLLVIEDCVQTVVHKIVIR